MLLKKKLWKFETNLNRALLQVDRVYLSRHGHEFFSWLRMWNIVHSVVKMHHISIHPSPVVSVLPWSISHLQRKK